MKPGQGKWRPLCALFSSFLILTSTFSSASPKPRPVGFYRLTNAPVDLTGDAGFSNANEDAIILIYGWGDIQSSPTDSSYYDWSNVWLNINLAKTAGKKVGLAFAGGRNYPPWLKSTGAYFFTFDVSDTSGMGNADMPLPWDTVFQGYWHAFINAAGAQFDGEAAVTYIRTSMSSETGLDFAFVKDSDASVTFSDGTTVNGSTAFSSPSANFVSTDVGLVISGPNFRGNTLVSSVTDPQHVVLSKTAAVTSTGATATFNIEQRLVGMGDNYKFDQLAAHHPSGYAGLTSDFSDATPAGVSPSSSTGYASSAAILSTSQTFSDWWNTAFPNTTKIWTYSAAFPTTNKWSVLDGATAKNYALTYPTYGSFYNGLQAQAPPYPAPVTYTIAHGEQFIHPSTASDIYSKPTPTPYPAAPQPLKDGLEMGWRKGNPFVEIYPNDLNSSDPAYQAVLTFEHPLYLALGTQPPTTVLNVRLTN
jgi:hypothetical protein